MARTPEQVRAYNKEYSTRPEAIESARIRNARPERVLKRKEYKKTEAGKLAERRYRATDSSVKYQHEYRLKKLYGITEDDYQYLYKLQNGQCAICTTTPVGRLHIDHDHTTNRVRGLLCGSCNRSIGLMKDSPQLLRDAARYLDI